MGRGSWLRIVEGEDLSQIAFDRVVDAISQLGFESFMLLDKNEPEYRVFESLLSNGIQKELVTLIGVCTGLIDYKVGEGGAAKLWQEVETIVSSRQVTSADDVSECMKLLLRRPICQEYSEQKTRRIERFFASGLPAQMLKDFRAVQR